MKILHKSFSILGNICSNPGKDKISTQPRYEIFKCDVFGSVSKLINKLSIFEELAEINTDFETWEAIAFFMSHVSKHLVLDCSKIEDMASSTDSGDFIN